MHEEFGNMLFDSGRRSDMDYPHRGESAFRYLNRSARLAAQRIRAELEKWYSRFPANGRRDVRERFRADDVHHYSAFFELLLHELLIRMSCELSIHENPGSGTPNRPDFLVHAPDRESFYLEAIVATNLSQAELAAEARANAVYDALNRLESPDFFIGVEVLGGPASQPSGKRLRRFLSNQLAAVDPDEISLRWQSGGKDAVPHWQYNDEGWEIRFFPVPKSPESRGITGIRPLGIEITPLHQIDCTIALRDAVKEKATRYGDLNLPFVIAVNAMDVFTRSHNCEDALLGTEGLVSYANECGSDSTVYRMRDSNGAWGTRTRPRATRVSAVLFVYSAKPWSIPTIKARLYQNPRAEYPYSSVLTALPQAWCPDGFQMVESAGCSIADILGIAPDWLHEPDDE